MSSEVNISGKRQLVGYVEPLEVLTVEYEFYCYGERATDTIHFCGGRNGSAIDHTIWVCGAGDVDRQCSIISQNATSYAVAISPQADIALTEISSTKGGCNYYCQRLDASALYSYDKTRYYFSGFQGSTRIHAYENADGNIRIYTQGIDSSSDVEITLEFEKKKEKIEVSTNNETNKEKGSVSGGGYYEVGSSFTITAIPNAGWRFSKWEWIPDSGSSSQTDPHQIDGNTSSSLTRTALPGTYSSNITQINQYKAIFERETYNCAISISNIPSDSSLSISAQVRDPDTGELSDIAFPISDSFKYQARIYVAVSASRDFWCNYKLSWDDEYIFPNHRYFDVPIGGISASGTFSRETYKVEISCSNGGDGPDGGGYYTVNGSGHYTSDFTLEGVHNGDTVTVIGYAKPDWHVYVSPSSSVTIRCYDENLDVRFYPPTYYNVSITSPEDQGCVMAVDATLDCLSSQQISLISGTSIHLLAKPNKCYKFLKWTGVPSAVETRNDFDIVVNHDMNISAVFAACSAGGRLIHCNGNILYDGETGLPIFQECDCSN